MNKLKAIFKWMFDNNGVVLVPRIGKAFESKNIAFKDLDIRTMTMYQKMYGRELKQRTCKACNEKFWSAKSTPVCNQLKCYLAYYG